MRNLKLIAVAGSALALAGCVTQPVGPMIQVLPAPYKPFEVFQAEHYECTRWSEDQTRGLANSANNRAIGATLVGTAVGAALGGAVGGGQGAGVGAAVGTVGGAAVGGGNATENNYSLQRRYDIAYAQCMYAKGNQIPGYGVPPGPTAPPGPPPRAGAAPPPNTGGPAPPPNYGPGPPPPNYGSGPTPPPR